MAEAPRAVLFDLLMAVMDSPAVWKAAAGPDLGLTWRDAVTAQMIAHPAYVPFEELVRGAAAELQLPPKAIDRLFAEWRTMNARPDAAAISRLGVPYAFLTNASARLAEAAADRSGLSAVFVLSAEQAGWYKPDARTYRLACARLATEPTETAFVAGAPYDAAGAHEAGLIAYLVPRRGETEQPRGVRLLPSLEAVDRQLRHS